MLSKTNQQNPGQPPHYDNHPPADLPMRPLIMIPYHDRKENIFVDPAAQSFNMRLLLIPMLLCVIWVVFHMESNLPTSADSGLFLGLLLAGILFTFFCMDYVVLAPNSIVQRPLRTQSDLNWVVSRRWLPAKSIALLLPIIVVLQVSILLPLNAWTWPVISALAIEVLVWVPLCVMAVGFSRIESQGVLYLNESSIEHKL